MEVLVDELDNGLAPFRALGIEEKEMGMVIGPRYDDNEEVWKIEVNVRAESSHDATLDMEYSFEELVAGEVVDEIYPNFIDSVEERYGEMQLEYTDPRI